ncbi:carbohydrate-binding module family 21 protein [Ophiostoma piceae UAMH 11346]|uniref:Carbohydrate-binding module family 21 protein n=1 Tax=Ophiostoma piceae (strain UAMH 11346) TaxID=1262450 RepID=S3DA91_OPHP1|nr:carbohydrate-binding module family 21 protein [Ophiostoma piceae UAMH 11346]
MPYTPPSHRSPSSSAASSPGTSRRPSFNVSKPAPPAYIASPASPALPRSSSYLARHRRTPSAVSASSTASTSSTSQSTQRSTSDDLKGMVSAVNTSNHANDEQSSIRQSPPPLTGDRRVMPAGAIISPPDSPPSSDDEGRVTRGRRIENMSELKELHEAISQLPKQRRASSPSEPADPNTLAVQPLQPIQTSNLEAMRHSFSASSLDHFTRVAGMVGRSSSQNGSNSGSNVSSRRVSHVRSATEPSISITPSGSSSQLNSDEENDLEIFKKPQMVRKKSGELVRPALRLGAGRRPSSMPGTPTFSKVVHFDSHLEHVRHFLQVDRPLAVSAGSSPVEAYDSESEYPFPSSGNSNKQTHRTPPYEWEIMLTKFPLDTPARKAQPVRLERVWLSPDHKFLHGSIAVLNLAFTKSVVCRFTLDYWKTTSEIAAEYAAEIVPRVATEGHDRFNFTIKLSDLANLESKTMYFCIRYSVAGKELWDNNNGSNFQLDFKKKMLPMNGKNGLQGSALPRSHHRRPNPSSTPRPRSMPVSLDDFEDGTKAMFDQSVQDYLGESEHPTLRLKSSQSALALPSDNLAGRLSSPSGQAFANRYDFGASLSAAMQTAKDVTPKLVKRDGLYMKSSRRGSPVPATANSASPAQQTTIVNTTKEPAKATAPSARLHRDSRAIVAESGVYGPGSIASKSYDEIVSKYCFYVPKPMAATKDASSHQGHNKSSSVGEIVTQPNQPSPASSTASDSSPVQIERFYLHGQQQQQQLVNPRWFDMPSRDSSSSSIQSFASVSSATVMASPSTRVAPRQSGTGSTASNSPASPASPATIVGAFPPYSGTPSGEFSYMKDRFPFNTTDGHSTPAIKG